MSSPSIKLPERAATRRSQGADVTADGVQFRVWSDHRKIDAIIVERDGKILRTVPLHLMGDGFHEGIDELGRAGDLYFYRLDGHERFPDPASRWQPEGVHGPSCVINPEDFAWSDGDWLAPAFSDLIIYELHVGTFTPQGTFRGVIDRLDYLAKLGVNAIELMPIADFPGSRNWGYDGVQLYAPARAYGTPDDLRELVDQAHARGLAVILDVVYNHLGPDGNYVSAYHSGYFNRRQKTPWGDSFDFARGPVRSFFAENAPYWREEFHVDGFRLDATHAIFDESQPHVLAEIAARVHERGGFVIAEDERNAAGLITPSARGGCGLDGVWADDFHHVVRVMLTGERDSYYANFGGTAAELVETMRNGWLYCGQPQLTDGVSRGSDCRGLEPEQFVYCISNHDQVGNRAFGERLGHLITPAAYRAVSALLCLIPETPMLFMGQEWMSSSPFQFFTDHNADLGRKITAGRRREFGRFAAFADQSSRDKIPDPQRADTFERSKLRWEERNEPAHAGIWQLYRECLRVRREQPFFRDRARDRWSVKLLAEDIIALRFDEGNQSCLVLADLRGNHAAPQLEELGIAGCNDDWEVVIDTNARRFGGADNEPFQLPTTILLTKTR